MSLRRIIGISSILLVLLALSCAKKEKQLRILVFSKTTGFRHESIPAGHAAIRAIAEKHNIAIDTTEDAGMFNEEDLKKYNAVVFLNTTGDVLNQEQQNDFERFIQAGGGYLGIHSATDTEYSWDWYGKLVGAYFESHPNNPNVRTAEFVTVDKTHPASDSLPDSFKRTDEFYNFKSINPDIHVLVKINEKSYEGGTNGDNHPMSWYHEFDGGRAFYTAMGHTAESYSESLVVKHIWGGLSYVLGGDEPKDLDYSLARSKRVPEENRFSKIVLDQKLEEPVELAVLPDSKVLFIERRGKVKLYDPAKSATEVITTIQVSTKYKAKDGTLTEAEDGLLGMALDPNFSKNNWVYFYYSAPGDDPKNILTRYEFKDGKLIEQTKKVMLEVKTQREECCHTGGSIAFDKNGNLFLSTGDNTNPSSTGYNPIDERKGREPWDAQKGTSNTNDLRGKVLRIHPEADGTYTIPEGNLFAAGTAKTRPEIYMMGGRNPYRISVDKHTGYLYWGDVGPDAGRDSVGRGTMAFDEINQARKPGFFGWPYFVGDNRAYYDHDFATGKPGEKFDPAKPVNNSPNNTGLTELPPAQKAFIWYPYDESKEFPLVGKGGRTAMAGPVFYESDFKDAKRAFPDYYDGKLFIYEWMRGWIMAVTMDKEGNYVSMERFMPNYKFSNPIDMDFGPDGDMYILEYGTAWFQANDDARLVRIEYTKGNRKPQIQLAADKSKGAVPLTVNLSSKGTVDFDRDVLTYKWKVSDAQGKELKSFDVADPQFTFDKPGVYKAALEVTDAKGEKSTAALEILAGNEPPALDFDITDGNKSFFMPGKPFKYDVKVTDKEDGTIGQGISAGEVSLTIDYLPQGFDKNEIAAGHFSADAATKFIKGKDLMDKSDCKSCHMLDKKSIGPMLTAVATKYKPEPKTIERLAKKIINGGGGVWGEVNMAAHPQISEADATEIVKYVLSVNDTKSKKTLPLNGSYSFKPEKGAEGVLLVRAAYTDKGANGLPAAKSEKSFILKSPEVDPGTAEVADDIQRYNLPTLPYTMVIGQKNLAHIGFKEIDMTGINQISFIASANKQYGMVGGNIEIRIDSPTGPVVGETSHIEATLPPPGFHGPPPIVKAKLKPTQGFHDLYLIYKNENTQGQSLFVISRVIFGG